jgi:tetratricopeptide (TPR) repeat protein
LIQTIEEANLSHNPSFTLAQVGQTLARNSEWQAAAWAFQNALNLNPEYVEVEAYLGLVLDRSGGDGYPHLRNAVEAAEMAPLPHIFLALHWQIQGDVDRAREELELAAQLDPSNPVVAAELGAAYAAIGEFPAAISAYQLATEYAPEEPNFWMLLAQFSLNHEIEVGSLGLPAARNAMVLDPNLAPALDALAYGHFLEGDFYLAERLISRAIQVQPRRALTQYHLGLISQAKGKIERATRALEFAILLDKEGGVAQLAERALNRIRP